MRKYSVDVLQLTRYFRKAMALFGSSLTGILATAHSPANRVVITKAKIRAISALMITVGLVKVGNTKRYT